MNFASSDMRSGVQGGSNVELDLDLLHARQRCDGVVDVLLDHRPGGAPHRRERVDDLDVRAVDLCVVVEQELDDVHPELMRSGVHGGSNVSSTSTCSTPGSAATASWMFSWIIGPAGQPIDVSEWITFTFGPSISLS